MNISLSFILIPWLLWEYNPHLMIALSATIVLPPGDIVWSLHLSIFCHTTHTEYQKSTRIAFLCSLHHKNIVLNQTLKKFNNLSPIIDAPQNHKSFYFFQNLARHNLEIKHFNYTRIFKSIIAKKPQLLEASHQLSTEKSLTQIDLKLYQNFIHFLWTLRHQTSIEPHTDTNNFNSI